MTSTEIRIELLKRKITMAAIGRHMGVSQPAIQRVIDRDLVSERIMIAIAVAIKYPSEQVFPEHDFNRRLKSNLE